MGIYDRDYFRDDEPQGFSLGGQWSAVGTIIVINVVVYLVAAWDGLGSPVNQALALHANLFSQLYADFQQQHYWEAWRMVTLLTHGFVHSQDGILHILLNMFVLWMFGSAVEGIYGKRLFWQLYLSLIVLAGLCWLATQNFLLYNPVMHDHVYAVGASGAVAGAVTLFILHFPKRTILLFLVIPMPAWVVGVLYLGYELFAAGAGSTNIAHSAHLGGVFFGFVFHRWHWTLFSILPTHWLPKLTRRKRGPDLRVVREESEEEDAPDEREVDRILAKISRLGTDSLTDEEHETLEAASRRLQKRRGVRMD